MIEVAYMKEMRDFLIKNPIEQLEVSKEEVVKLEETLKINFPKAYYEFLILSGEQFCPIKMGHRFITAVDRNQNAHTNIQKYGVDLGRDIWVVAETGASMYLSFFYLDEGDNPPMYRLDLYHFVNIKMHHEEMKTHGHLVEADPIDESYEYVQKTDDSFSDFIISFIEMYDPQYD